jgi:hypothetical protein
MFKTVSRVLPAFIAFVFLVSMSTHAFAGLPQTEEKDSKKDKDRDKDKDKQKAKKDSDAKPEPEKLSKQESEYQKIKMFSDDLYGKDVDFRNEVEESYRQKVREHSEYAFFINTRDAADDQITRTGDKLKIDDTLYDNPLVQDYVNRVGQSVVPKDSRNLFAFKVTLNPIPEARSLSTGTVYISSGLLSQVDNEAQLAYVLGHEIGHIEKNHWHQDVLVERGMERYNEKQQQKRKLIGGVASIGAGVVTAGVASSVTKGAVAGLLAQVALPSILKLAIPNAVVTWDKAQEDDADQLALKYMLDRSYDPREVPKFYASMQRATQKDPRAGGGFMADANRLVERTQQVNTLVGGFSNLSTTGLMTGAATYAVQQANGAAATQGQPAVPAQDIGKGLNVERDAAGRAAAATKAIASGPLSAELQAKLESGELIGSSAEFEAVMAELKRDNGVRAYYYDMFQMSRDNLEESIRIRSNDAYAHYYYGKLLKLTARTAVEKQHALTEFVKATELDKRRVLGEPRLYRALSMIDAKDTSQNEIVESLKDYVGIYQREHGGQLPPNMDVIYDYLQEVGETAWAAHPAMNVSTKNIDPIVVNGGGSATPAPAAQAVPTGAATPAANPTPLANPTPNRTPAGTVAPRTPVQPVKK